MSDGGRAVLTRAAERQATALDVLMCYQVFLGRDPESDQVVALATREPVRAHFRAFLAAEEFQSVVRERLRHGARLPHERLGPGPSAAHLAWVARHLLLPAAERARLLALRDWPELVRLICRADQQERDDATLRLAEHVALPGGVLLRPAPDCVIGVEPPRPAWIEGWAVRPGNPPCRLAVELGIEGGAVARQRASQARPEVALLFGGDGRAGFAFGPLPALAEGVACVALLRVWAVDEDRALTEWLRVCVEPQTGL